MERRETRPAANPLQRLPAPVVDLALACLMANELFECRLVSAATNAIVQRHVATAKSLTLDLRWIDWADAPELEPLLFVSRTARQLRTFTVLRLPNVASLQDEHDDTTDAGSIMAGHVRGLLREIVARNKQSLERLVDRPDVLANHMAELAECPNIRALDISDLTERSRAAKHCTRLERLRLNVPEADWPDLKCPASLRHLSIVNTEWLEPVAQFTNLVGLEIEFPHSWPGDLDVLSAALAPLGRLEALQLGRKVDSIRPVRRMTGRVTAHAGPMRGALVLPTVRALNIREGLFTVAQDSAVLAAGLAAPRLRELVHSNMEFGCGLGLAKAVPDLLSLMQTCSPFTTAECDSDLKVLLGRTDCYPLRRLESLVLRYTLVTQRTLETIGAVFPKLTHLSVNLGEYSSIVPFCRMVADRLVDLCVWGHHKPGSPDSAESVVMRTLTKLDISGVESRVVAAFSFPELATLRAQNDGGIWSVLAKSPKLAHLSLTLDNIGAPGGLVPGLDGPTGASGDPPAAKAAKAAKASATQFPLVTQLYLCLGDLGAEEVERTLALFPCARWVDVRRTCGPRCGTETRSMRLLVRAAPCIDAGKTLSDLHPHMSPACRDRIVSMVARQMPQLRELYVSPYWRQDCARVHVRLGEIQLLGLDHLVPRYCDGLQGSTRVMVDEQRPWDESAATWP